MHFAVPYTDKDGVPRCFYVDYIIRLKNGTICLFDTKSKDSDPNAPNKHNALLDYIKTENEKNHKRLIGGVIIEQNDNWYYSPMKIENTSDLQGWDTLDLTSVNVEP
jgi:type III restriction enzyme